MADSVQHGTPGGKLGAEPPISAPSPFPWIDAAQTVTDYLRLLGSDWSDRRSRVRVLDPRPIDLHRPQTANIPAPGRE